MPAQLDLTADGPVPEPLAPRLVLDTGIAVLAVSRPYGRLRWLRDAWHDGRIIPLTSDYTEREFQRILRNSDLNIQSFHIRELEIDYLDYRTKLTVAEPPIYVPTCRDRKDQPFLDLAYYAEADYLVTEDGDLLVLSDLSMVPIIEPAQLRSIPRHGL